MYYTQFYQSVEPFRFRLSLEPCFYVSNIWETDEFWKIVEFQLAACISGPFNGEK